jgi:general stress protein 26
MIKLAKEDFKKIVSDLLKNQKLGVLATDLDGLPYTSLIAFASTDDLKSIVFSTLKDTRKFSNMIKNPRVTLLIDNRSNQSADFYEAIAAAAQGSVEEIYDSENKFKKLYLSKHPYLEEFVNSPNCALMKLKIEKYHYVSRFQDVKILELGD